MVEENNDSKNTNGPENTEQEPVNHDHLKQILHEALVDYWQTLAVKHAQTEHLFLATTYIPFAFMNIVLHRDSTLDSGELATSYVEAEQFFRSSNTPWTWWLEPHVQVRQLDAFLTRRNFRVQYACPSMFLDMSQPLDSTPLAGFEFHEADSREDFNQWLKPIRRSFNCPEHVFDLFGDRLHQVPHGPNTSFRHFTIVHEGQTVAASTIHVSRNSCTLYNVATLPEYRKHGFGAAITRYSVLAAQQTGAPYCFLDSSKVGYNIYYQLGFRTFAECRIYGPNK